MNKKYLKNNEKNPKINDPFEKMTLAQVEAELKNAETQLQDLISKGNYPQAEICNKKIENLKAALKRKKAKEISRRHYKEKKNLIQDKVSDVGNLSYLWDQRFEELQLKSKSILDELKNNQEKELQQLLSQYQQSSNDVKPSALYLQLKKEEEGLVKLRKFKEAEVIRKKKEYQRKIDESKSERNKENTYKNYEKKLRQKHMNELQYLQNKFQAEFDELLKEKQKDMEFLDKKYSVKSKDLVNQQKREDTINKFDNYKNRIANLTNNYEIKYTIEKSENNEPIKKDNLERIYAEINENNKYIEEEILKDSERTPTRERIGNKNEIKNLTENDKKNGVQSNDEDNEEKEDLKDVEIPEYEN